LSERALDALAGFLPRHVAVTERLLVRDLPD
jgi:hypothetical protein